MHTLTVYLPDSPLVVFALGFVGVLITVRAVGWIWQQFPFV